MVKSSSICPSSSQVMNVLNIGNGEDLVVVDDDFIIGLNLNLVTKVKAISHFNDSTYRGLTCITVVTDYDKNVNFFICLTEPKRGMHDLVL